MNYLFEFPVKRDPDLSTTVGEEEDKMDGAVDVYDLFGWDDLDTEEILVQGASTNRAAAVEFAARFGVAESEVTGQAL